MTKESSNAELERIDAAFNRVLAAEAAAREQVDACRGEAELLVAQAEARAGRIASRADDRVLAVQRRAEAGLRRALAQLPGIVPDVTPDATEPDLDPSIDARLTEALDTLADEMIGVTLAARPFDRGGVPG